MRSPQPWCARSSAGSDEARVVTRLKEQFEDRDGIIEREALAFIAELRSKNLVQD